MSTFVFDDLSIGADPYVPLWLGFQYMPYIIGVLVVLLVFYRGRAVLQSQIEKFKSFMGVIKGASDLTISGRLIGDEKRTLELMRHYSLSGRRRRRLNLVGKSKRPQVLMSSHPPFHYTAIHEACAVGNEKSLKVLMTHNSRKRLVAFKTIFGSTALHRAAVSGSAECCAMLLKAGQNVNAVDVHGNTPMMCAIISGTTNREMLKAYWTQEQMLTLPTTKGEGPLI